MCDSLPLLSFPLLSHCTTHLSSLHYFSTHLQIHNKIILPSISVKSFSCSSMFIPYWVTDSNWILNSYKTHSEVAVSLSHSDVEWWKQDITVPHDTQCKEVLLSFLHGLYNWQVVPIIVQSHFAQMSSKNLLIHIKVASQPTCVLQEELSLLINILIFSVCFLLDSKNFEVAVVVLFTSVILNRVSHPQFLALTPCT